jgi:hypothetical protein
MGALPSDKVFGAKLEHFETDAHIEGQTGDRRSLVEAIGSKEKSESLSDADRIHMKALPSDEVFGATAGTSQADAYIVG